MEESQNGKFTTTLHCKYQETIDYNKLEMQHFTQNYLWSQGKGRLHLSLQMHLEGRWLPITRKLVGTILKSFALLSSTHVDCMV